MSPVPTPIYFPEFVMPEHIKLYAVQHEPWGYFITEQPEYVDMSGSRFINIKIDQFCYKWLSTYRDPAEKDSKKTYDDRNPKGRWYNDVGTMNEFPSYLVIDSFLINNILPQNVLEVIIRAAVSTDLILGEKIRNLREEIEEKHQEMYKAELDYEQILLIREKFFK